jgi:hypothetical protein
MDSHQKIGWIDPTIVAVANSFNLIMVGIFYARTRGALHPLIFGLVWAVLILLLAAAGISNLRAGRVWWSYVLPLIMVIFLALELVLDYFLQYDFRSTSLLTPYLILYYLAILGMIGYGFQTGKKWGFITLATYFLSQAAALYSYSLVGHG